MTRPILLVDGDSVAYKAACAGQEAIDWGDGVSVDADMSRAVDHMSSTLDLYMDTLNASGMIVCLGNDRNWRKELWPEYKANRRNREKPVLLKECCRYLRDNHPTESWDRLEADDVMGILANSIKGAVIVSIDKDMRSVPCLLFNPNRPEEGVQLIDPIQAFRNHMIQTLAGDAADGYKGCPGIGPKKAGAIVDPLLPDVDGRVSAADLVLDFKESREKIWKKIMETYVTRGSTVCAARLNARLAHILHQPKRYNRETAKLKLWQPPL